MLLRDRKPRMKGRGKKKQSQADGEMHKEKATSS